MKSVYIQGNLIKEDKASINYADRGLRFGDGIFETIRVENGDLFDFDLHLKRLRTGLGYLKIDAETSKLEAASKELIKHNNFKNGFVRIAITRGIGSKGYTSISAQPTIIIETIDGLEEPIDDAALYISSYKAYIYAPAKTLNSLNYVLSLMEAKENNCHSALLLNHSGIVCETSSANIFWIKGDNLYTPETNLELIPGTLRERLLAISPLKVIQGSFKINDVAGADELFMTNVNYIVQPFAKLMPLGVNYKIKQSLEIRKILQNDLRSRVA